MNGSNVAYSYDDTANDDFEEDNAERVPQARKNIKVSRNSNRKNNESKNGSVLGIILISALAVVLLGSVIYMLDKRNSVYNEVADLNRQLNLAEAENVRLQSELESKMSAKNVEDYAENVLGMKKMDSSQIKYIKIQTDDVVNIPEQEQGITAKIKGFFEDCVEYFRG
ncbi:MAG: hypothetical protein K2J08_12165 [Ruminococcus sp.]|nr:hypothetical protein [Ruminococcus sp.]